MAFKARLINLAHVYCGSTTDKSDFYLHPKHLNTVNVLSSNYNIIISKPDKKTVVVILDKEDCNNKMTDIVKDTT